jgi:hypothetical protein
MIHPARCVIIALKRLARAFNPFAMCAPEALLKEGGVKKIFVGPSVLC